MEICFKTYILMRMKTISVSGNVEERLALEMNCFLLNVGTDPAPSRRCNMENLISPLWLSQYSPYKETLCGT